MITYNYNRYGSDSPFTPSKYIKTNLEVLLKMLDGEDLKQYKETPNDCPNVVVKQNCNTL